MAIHGAMALLPMDVPLRFSHGRGFSGVLLVLPAPRVRQRGVALDRPRVLPAAHGLGRVAADGLRSLREQRATLDERAFDAVVDRLIGPVCLSAADAAAAQPAAITASIRRNVREHAEDPALDGRTVADALGWSLRYVQRALQQEGTTPRELIREERLALARLRIVSPVCADWSLERIALSCGFGSASVFARAFRRAYGEAPGTLRP